MNSLRHVFWRGAMALSLMALGIGSGVGFRDEAVARSGGPDCDAPSMRAVDASNLRRARVERRWIDPARAVASQREVRSAARRG